MVNVRDELKDFGNQISNTFATTMPVYGVGLSAYERLVPSFFYPNYRIISYKHGNDLPLIRTYADTVNFQADYPGEQLRKINSYRLLSFPQIKKLYQDQPQKGLYSYKYKKPTLNLSRRSGFTSLHNNLSLQDRLETKGEFMDICAHLRLPQVESVKVAVGELSDKRYQQLLTQLGPKLVVQIADLVSAGGLFTFFINNQNEFQSLLHQLQVNPKLRQAKMLKVAQFIEGKSVCVTASVTDAGVVLGTVRSQAIGIPDITGKSVNQGEYCGNDWDFGEFGASTIKQIDHCLTTFGAYIGERGYRGIFALDFIIEDKTGRVYPLECNPRYQGSSAIEGLMMLSQGLLPLDVYHFAQFLAPNIITPEIVTLSNQLVRKTRFAGGQLILRNNLGRTSVVGGNVAAGIYTLQHDQLVFERSGLVWADIKKPEEILVTNSVVRQNQVLERRDKLATVAMMRPILEQTSMLTEFASSVVRATYRQFNLLPGKDL